MPGLPYTQLERDTPESIVDNYLQRGLQDIQQRFEFQWNEVNSRAETLGQRKQMEMLNELQSKTTQEMMAFRQQAQQQVEQLQRMDRLAQQAGTDPREAKMRAVLSPEEEMAAFPKETAPRSMMAQYGELDIYENRLEAEAPEFMTVPSKRAKAWLRAKPGGYLGVAWPWKEKITGPVRMVYDPDLEPAYDEKKKVWTKGGYRPVTQEDIQEKIRYDAELADVRRQKRELMSQPDIATRVRGAALRVKRDPEHTSFVEKVQQSKPKPKAPPVPREQKAIRQRNTRTGQMRISYDGGQTWSIL